MHDQALVNVVAQLTASLDRHKIKWCVLRNYETFPKPRSDTSDLDLLLDCTPQIGLSVLEEVLRGLPVNLARIFTKSDRTLLAFFIAVKNGPAIHIDLIFRITWRGFDLLASNALLVSRQIVSSVPIPRVGHEAASSMLTFLFHHNRMKVEYTSKIQQQVQLDREGFLECTTPVWGHLTATELANRCAAGDWEWFKTWVKNAKAKIIQTSWRTPITTVCNSVRVLANVSTRVTSPPGIWIAFLGPDGAGKTTVGTAYRARLETLFYPDLQRQLHWRPRLLPAPGEITGETASPSAVTRPHLKPPHGRLKSLVRLAYFWVDYVLGHWVRVRPLLAKGGLVIFDRYYQDFLVDPKRYRMALPSWLFRWVGKTVPQPELIFVFDAPAEVLFARKQELQLTEIEAQLHRLRYLAHNHKTARLIRVDRSVEAIVDEMVGETLKYLNQRNRRRLGWAEEAQDSFNKSEA